MIIFKYLEYSCLWICNVDDIKIIDWIWIRWKLVWQSELNKNMNKTEKTNTAKRRLAKQRRIKTTKSQKKN